jgi:hypothetical protein
MAVVLLDDLGIDLEAVRRQVLEVVARPGVATTGKSPTVIRTRDNVVTCRVDDRALAALDALVEAGVYSTRSEAAARLILAGIEANGPLLEKVYANVAEIRRIREQTQHLTRDWSKPDGAGQGAEAPRPGPAAG